MSIGENIALLSGKLLLILVILMALGPANQGSFALFLTIQTSALTIAAIGLEPALMYWGSKRSNMAARRALFGNSLLTSMLSGAIAACGAYLLSILGTFSDSFSETERMLLAVAIQLSTVALVLSGLLGGIGRFDIRFIGVAAQNSIAVVGSLLVIALGANSLQPIIMFWVAGLAVNVTIWIIALYKLTGGITLSKLWAKRQFRTASQTYGYLILSLAAMRVDVFIVSHMLGLTALGFYSIASAVAELLLYLPKSIANPVLVRSADSSTPFPYSEIFRSLAALLALVALLCGGVGLLVLTAFGAEMDQVVLLLLLLLPGTYLLGLGTTAAYALFGLHEMQRPLAAAATAATTKVFLALMLIHMIGLEGAAIATSVSYTAFAYITLKGIASKAGTSLTIFATPDFVSLFHRFAGLTRTQRS